MELKEYFLESVSSTNDWLKQRLSDWSEADFIAVCADQQTEGRGQRAKSWHSPAKTNLYLSFCFQTQKEEIDPLQVTHLLALTVASKLKEEGLIVHFKWPNDLFIKGKKIAGILCETISTKERLACIVGIGLNLNMKEEECSHISQPATSLFIESGKLQKIHVWKEKITQNFFRTIMLYLEKGLTSFTNELIELRFLNQESP